MIFTNLEKYLYSKECLKQRRLLPMPQSRRYFLGFWIPHRGFRIPRNWISVIVSETWILDSSLQKDCGFHELLFPQANIYWISESGFSYSFLSPQSAQCIPSASSLTDFPVLHAFSKRLHFPL